MYTHIVITMYTSFQHFHVSGLVSPRRTWEQGEQRPWLNNLPESRNFEPEGSFHPCFISMTVGFFFQKSYSFSKVTNGCVNSTDVKPIFLQSIRAKLWVKWKTSRPISRRKRIKEGAVSMHRIIWFVGLKWIVKRIDQWVSRKEVLCPSPLAPPTTDSSLAKTRSERWWLRWCIHQVLSYLVFQSGKRRSLSCC